MIQIYPWQKLQWEKIIQQCTSQQAPHAFLLTGPKVSGKTAFAMAFAAWLLCEERMTKTEACGQCRACHWFNSQTHPDFFTLSPEGNTIKIDQIRDLIHQLVQTTVQSSCQVVLISPAETMNISAANALLKTLEEPSGTVIFILVAHSVNKIPVTIRSRVQSVLFPVPSLEEAKAWLSSKISSNKSLDFWLSIAGGLPLKALALAQQPEGLNERDVLFECLSRLAQKEIYPVQAAETLLKQNLSTLLTNWFSILVDLMRLMSGVKPEYWTHQDKAETLNLLAKNATMRSLVYYQHTFRKALWEHQNHPNLNATLFLEHLLIQWRKMCW